MAVDSADKRASALLVGVPAGRVYPTPDGGLATAADRSHMAYLYRGLAVEASFDTTLGAAQTWLPTRRPTAWLPAVRPTVWNPPPSIRVRQP